jgi:hypothetical protein
MTGLIEFIIAVIVLIVKAVADSSAASKNKKQNINSFKPPKSTAQKPAPPKIPGTFRDQVSQQATFQPQVNPPSYSAAQSPLAGPPLTDFIKKPTQLSDSPISGISATDMLAEQRRQSDDDYAVAMGLKNSVNTRMPVVTNSKNVMQITNNGIDNTDRSQLLNGILWAQILSRPKCHRSNK